MIEPNILEIDGALGEGGGSILRLAAGFSILYNRPIRIKKIRENRPKPGLRLQHLLGLKALRDLTESTLSDCQVGTRELLFSPNPFQSIKRKIQINITTAASIGLLLQPIQIACLGFAKPEKIEISLEGGGTFGKWAPSMNYLQRVTYPILANSGFTIEIEIQRHGFFPKGGSRSKCFIYPNKDFKPINLLELGNIDLIKGEIIISEQLKKNTISERIRNSIQKEIKTKLNIKTDIKCIWVQSSSPGVGLSLWAHSDTGAIISTGTLLGERNISSEKLGVNAAQELINYIQKDIPVDNYLSDQLLPLMAYVKSASRIRVLEITSHTKTNLELIKQFSNREYHIIKDNKEGFIIEYQ